jgi:pimeloyl-ACP methyl ester carboxylesterase
MEGGTRQFVGSPDAWAEIPAEIKDVMIANAPTFLAELRDPEAFAFDLEQLRAFPHPALLTTSEHDMPFGSSVVEKVASVLPQAERVNVADANHDVQISQPEAFARTLRDFLTRVSVSA